MKENKSLLGLFLSFAKVGVMTFGGGYAMLPMLQREIVENKHFATEDELMNYFAVGQCTPGVIAVNTATFIGHKERGIIGGIVATLGVVFPSFMIICLLASFLSFFSSNIYVAKAFAGIRVSVCALITMSVLKMAKKAVKDFETLVFAVLALILELFLKITPVLIVLSAIVYSLAVYFASKGRKEKGE